MPPPPLPEGVTAMELGDALNLLKDVKARFVSDPSAYAEFVGILRRFKRSEITDAGAVIDRSKNILDGQPDLAARFHTFLPASRRSAAGDTNVVFDPNGEGPVTNIADPTGGTTNIGDPTGGEGTSAGNKVVPPRKLKTNLKPPGGSDIATAANRRPSRGQRRHHAAAAVDVAGEGGGDGDGDSTPASQFLDRVKRAGRQVHEDFMVLLARIKTEVTLDAHEIYELAKNVFGADNRELLDGFVQFLPAAEHPRLPGTKRRPAAIAIAIDIDIGIDAGAGRPSRAKRRRGGDSRSRTTTDVGSSGAATTGATELPNGWKSFRASWEFETRYSKLVATMRRTEELLKELDADAAVADDPPRRQRTFGDLFPSSECREVLHNMYVDEGAWPPMQAALEDGGRRRLALERILARTMQLEVEAVSYAMERRDPVRVEARLKMLVAADEASRRG